MIHSISIFGWRSFAPTTDAQPLDNPQLELSRVNLLLGANNVGKSNVARFLAWLSKAMTAAGDGFWRAPVNHRLPVGHDNFWNLESHDILAYMRISASAIGLVPSLFDRKGKLDGDVLVRVLIEDVQNHKGTLSVTPLIYESDKWIPFARHDTKLARRCTGMGATNPAVK